MFFLSDIASNAWLFWFVCGIVFIILEIFTEGFFIGLIGVSSLFTGLLALLTKNINSTYSILIQSVFFIIVLSLLIIFLRPILLKFVFSKKNRSSGVSALVGKISLVTENINNLENRGYIKINGDHWKARSIDNTEIIKGEKIIVEKIDGNTLYVKKV